MRNTTQKRIKLGSNRWNRLERAATVSIDVAVHVTVHVTIDVAIIGAVDVVTSVLRKKERGTRPQALNRAGDVNII